jgi:hypothetical protein
MAMTIIERFFCHGKLMTIQIAGSPFPTLDSISSWLYSIDATRNKLFKFEEERKNAEKKESIFHWKLSLLHQLAFYLRNLVKEVILLPNSTFDLLNRLKKELKDVLSTAKQLFQMRWPNESTTYYDNNIRIIESVSRDSETALYFDLWSDFPLSEDIKASCVLSFDAGGTRGVMGVQMLRRLIDRLEVKEEDFLSHIHLFGG